MKNIVVGMVVACVLALFIGIFSGCAPKSDESKPAGKKQDGIPLIVTDKIPEDPEKKASSQSQTQTQENNSVNPQKPSLKEALEGK